jgi:hypothetical protein
MKRNKIICFLLPLILLIYSCQKEDDIILPGGNKSLRIKSVKHYTNGVLGNVTDYIYDNSGSLISLETTNFEENGDTNNSYSRTFEYEGNKIINYRNNPYTGVRSGIKTEREIENGRVSKIHTFEWNGAEWDMVSRTSYLYEGTKLSRWNIISFISFFNYMTEGEITYKADLPVQKTEKYLYYDNLWNSVNRFTSYHKELYDYVDGRMEKVIGYYKSDRMEDWNISYKLEYERSGQEVSAKHYWFTEDETWIHDWTTISTYNEQGYVTRTKTMSPGSHSGTETVTEYENKPGNWEVVLEDPELLITSF